ncbi:hypothetical protein COCVIDRAFT_111850, partial [Bipolaris victoriae FI3]
ILYRFLKIASRPRDYPPGPPTLPLIGNLHQIPNNNIHLQYQKWAKQYGPIFSLKLGQSTTIVLADGQVIHDLVDLRGSNYADRPKLWVRELKYLPYQELKTLQLLTQIEDDPETFVLHVGRMTGSMATSIAYGFRLPNTTDLLTHEMLENSPGFFQCVVKSQILDWYPSLKPFVNLIPRVMNPWAKEALATYEDEKRVVERAYERGIQGRLPCFATDIEASKSKSRILTDHAAVYIAGIAFEEGADTTRHTLQGLFKAMALFPETQKTAQVELDKVVGPSTLPSGDHLTSLKYIRCTAKELVRWMPNAINGAILHAAVAEDKYCGYRIPSGAAVVLAVWSASHDSQDFDDPRTFRPERQDPETSLLEASNAPSPKSRGFYGFGSGRRICPGMHVAENTLLLAIARILWTFDISKAKDSSGNVIETDRDAMVGGLAAKPAPFKGKIVPRSAERMAIIDKEWENLAADCLDADGNYKQSMFNKL